MRSTRDRCRGRMDDSDVSPDQSRVRRSLARIWARSLGDIAQALAVLAITAALG